MYITHANTVYMSHQGLSGTSIGPHTTFLSQSQDSSTVGRRLEPNMYTLEIWPKHRGGGGDGCGLVAVAEDSR